MCKVLSTLFAAVIALWATGAVTDANAGHKPRGCCGPIPPTYHSKTKVVHKYIRRVYDHYRTKYVKRPHLIVNVTRVQPVYHIHNINRVHTTVVGVEHRVYRNVTQYLPPRVYVKNTTTYDTRCDCRRYGLLTSE